MSTQDSWDKANERFLAAVLEWLRLRLRWLADEARDEARKSVDDAAVEMRAGAVGDPLPAPILLRHLLGLKPFELDVLLLCVAVDLDPSMPGLCAAAQRDPRMAYPTFALALSLFEEPTWDALAPRGSLRYWRLIEITQPAGQPLTSSPLRADERIVSYMKGLNYLDDRLEPLLTLTEPPVHEDLPASQQAVVESISTCWNRLDADGVPPVIQLVGPDAPTKRLVAARAAADLGRSLYSITAETLPSTPADVEELARLWRRESILTSVALYLDAQEVDRAAREDAKVEAVARFLARGDGVTFLGTREVWPSVPRAQATFDVERPTAAEQRDAWIGALAADGMDDAAAELAGQFSLNLPAIQRVAREALSRPVDDTAQLRVRLWDECLLMTRPRMDALAQRIVPKATWNDIVLPEPELALLHRVTSQLRHRMRVYETWGFARRMNRGLGISALFAGPSGTGKSMAAEVIANDLRLTLYRIDLSAVVSKYIGETEKNLSRLFDAAEEGGALLLFDEADALFGKRSEVKDSHDRYANIEINYLLQRMEAYRGVAILATNMKSALDTAFMRRLRFIVSFPFPSVVERTAMWEKAFPERVPTEGLDAARLALLPATGGMIHNIVLNAAFAAADRDLPVSMDIVMEVARTEFRKLELPIVEREFEVEDAMVMRA
jgi:ATPase family protein associated with various cellular activities (AAA)/winged helix domain-containing protein